MACIKCQHCHRALQKMLLKASGAELEREGLD